MPKANQVVMKEEKRLNVILPVKTHTDFKTAVYRELNPPAIVQEPRSTRARSEPLLTQ